MTTVRDLFQDLRVFYMSNFEKHKIINPLFQITSDDSILTWANYKSREYFFTYDEYYVWVNDNLQYSVAIEDGVLLQIFFKEIKNEIRQASLTFLPNPNLLMPYIRFDLDLDNYKDYYHNSYHVNFGYNTANVRFTLQRFPYPSEFLRFALFLLGNDQYVCFERKRFFEDLMSRKEQFSHHFDFTIR